MALSNAERQARWRAKRDAAAKRVENLEAEVERLKAEIARLKGAQAAQPAARRQHKAAATRRANAEKRRAPVLATIAANLKKAERDSEAALAAAKARMEDAHPDKGGPGGAAWQEAHAAWKAEQKKHAALLKRNKESARSWGIAP